jgi:hypothetical protein
MLIAGWIQNQGGPEGIGQLEPRRLPFNAVAQDPSSTNSTKLHTTTAATCQVVKQSATR